MKNHLISGLVFFALTIATNAAYADAKADADTLHKEALEFLEKNQLVRAESKLDRANKLNPSWKYSESYGRLYQAQGKNADARAEYEKFLKKGGKGISKEKRSEIQGLIEQIDKKAERNANYAKAKDHYDKGKKLRSEQKYEHAMIELELAYELYDEYIVQKDIAEVEVLLGNNSRAISAYKIYLKDGKDKISDQEKSDVEKRIAQLSGKKEEKEEPVVAVVPPKEEEEEPASEEADKPEEPAEEETAEAEPEPEEEEEPGEPFDMDPKKRFWSYIAFSVGGAGAISAVVTGIVAKNEQDKVDEVCPPNEPCGIEWRASVTDREDIIGKLTTVRNISIGVGAGGIAAGILLYFLEPKVIKNPRVSVAPVIHPKHAGLFLTTQF